MEKVKLIYLPDNYVFEVPVDVAAIYLKYDPDNYEEVKQRRTNERNR